MKPVKYTVLVLTVVLVLCGVLVKIGVQNPVTNFFRELFAPVQSLFSRIRLTDESELLEENKRLLKTLAQTDAEKRENIALKQENDRLRRLLLMQEKETTFETVACRVIAKDADFAHGNFRVDRGTNHGIQVGSAVLSYRGLAGTVTAVTKHSATVTPITAKGNTVGVRVVRTQTLAVAETETEDGCILSCFEKENPPVVGDVLETSGIGGLYPEGIAAYIVEKVRPDGTAELSPITDIVNLKEVLIER